MSSLKANDELRAKNKLALDKFKSDMDNYRAETALKLKNLAEKNALMQQDIQNKQSQMQTEIKKLFVNPIKKLN